MSRGNNGGAWAIASAGAVIATMVLAASCSNDDVRFDNEDDDSSSAGGEGAGSSTGGTGLGPGGSGGVDPFDCSECTESQVCVDGASCEDACPVGRDACQPDTSAAGICCAAAEQCCEAGPLLANDVCVADSVGCPFTCPDGVTNCNGDQLCALDHLTDTYTCVDQIDCPLYECGNLCCPLGSTCGVGGCIYPDLTINEARIASSYEVSDFTFQTGSCSFFEGCIGAIGTRDLLRFDLQTPNIGDGDLFLGDPDDNAGLFTFSSCHQHFHFDSYARYRLLDLAMNEVATGHKQAFCLMDVSRIDNSAAPQALYTCSFQGIQRGWADTYTADLPCQWVDITSVASGDYLLEVIVNGDQVLAETDYTNNSALVPITIP